jgi:predicted GIY-YIG superfamily endonuclease
MVITVYVLKSIKDLHNYVGMTNSVVRRFHQHQSGQVKSTKNRRPFQLIHSKEFPARTLAREYEKYLKSAAGKRYLKKLLVGQQPSNLPD